MGEPAVEEAAPAAEETGDEEDGPLEDWTKKELAEECKNLGLSDKGTKAVLIARIKEAKAAAEPAVEASTEEVPMEAEAAEVPAVEEVVAEEAPVEQAPVEEA